MKPLTPAIARRVPLATILIALLLGALLLAACGGQPQGATTGADQVRAQVNGSDVHQSDVDQVRAEARFGNRSDDPGKALDEAIGRELVRQEAKRLGLKADTGEVDRRVAAVTKQAGGDTGLAQVLKGARMTKAQLRAALEYVVLKEAVQNARYPGLVASEAKLHAFYQKNRADLFTQPASVHLAAIVVHNTGIAANALKRVREGWDFRIVSAQFSMDPQLKQDGGDMGWVVPASIPQPLAKTVAALGVGQVSKPVAGPGGVYIFKVLARRPARVSSFASVHDELAKELTRRARAAALQQWIDKTKASASISKP